MIEHPEKFPQTFPEFSAFIKENQNRFVRHAYFRLGNREEAEDIVQEVMIRVYRERENKQHITQPISYIFRMVYNSCIDHLRKKTITFREPTAGDDPEGPIDGANREKEIIAFEEYERISKMLSAIPEEQTKVIRLRILDEMSFVDIAQLLNIPVTTVKSRFSYGIIKLRTKISMKEEKKYELH